VYDFYSIIAYATRMVQIGKICVNKGLKEIGLTSSESDVLMFLYANGDDIRQNHIAAGVEVSKAAISRTINSLERKGYIVREQRDEDRRAWYVRLSHKAWVHKEFIQKQYADLVEAACRGIDEHKVAEIVDIFKTVVDNMEEYRVAQGT